MIAAGHTHNATIGQICDTFYSNSLMCTLGGGFHCGGGVCFLFYTLSLSLSGSVCQFHARESSISFEIFFGYCLAHFFEKGKKCLFVSCLEFVSSFTKPNFVSCRSNNSCFAPFVYLTFDLYVFVSLTSPK